MGRISFGLSTKEALQKFAFILVENDSNISLIPVSLKYVLPTLLYIVKLENIFVSGIGLDISGKIYIFNKISVRQGEYVVNPKEIYLSGIAVRNDSLVYIFDDVSVRSLGYILQ